MAAAKKQGTEGLKGHRSVAGIRVSIYDAAEPAWCQALAGFMAGFQAMTPPFIAVSALAVWMARSSVRRRR